MFIDIHCHLDMLEDVDRIIKRARRKRVSIILANGVNIETNRKVLDFSEKFKEVKACLGIYPIDALSISDKEVDEEIDFISRNRKRVASIGEVGLDFSEDEEIHKKQEKIFRKFIVLAMELNIPITVHSRKAELECIELLEELGAKKVIMHYFSGKMKLVDRIVENKWFLSIPTCIKHSEHFQKLVGIVPIENLLCETDSPYSHPDKKFPNEPGNIIKSYEMIAKIKSLELDEVEGKIEGNFMKLFGLLS